MKYSLLLALGLTLCAALFAGCAVEDDLGEAESAIEAYAVNVNTEDSPIRVQSYLGTVTCSAFNTCSYLYAQGTNVTLTVTRPTNNIDCLKFVGWTGVACTGAAPCSFPVNQTTSVGTRWGRIAGCIPR